MLAGAPPGGQPYDVVFADPPYALSDDEVTAVLAALAGGGWLAPDAVWWWSVHRSPEPTWVPGVTLERVAALR